MIGFGDLLTPDGQPVRPGQAQRPGVQSAAPVQAPPSQGDEMQQRVADWRGFWDRLVENPNLQQAFIRGGLSMLERAPGQTSAGNFAEGFGVGLDTYNQLGQQDVANARANRNEQREDRRLDQGDRRIANETTSTVASVAQGAQRLSLQERRLLLEADEIQARVDQGNRRLSQDDRRILQDAERLRADISARERELGQGDRRLDQADVGLAQSGRQIDSTIRQGDRRLDQADRGLDQSGRQIDISQQNADANTARTYSGIANDAANTALNRDRVALERERMGLEFGRLGIQGSLVAAQIRQIDSNIQSTATRDERDGVRLPYEIAEVTARIDELRRAPAMRGPSPGAEQQLAQSLASAQVKMGWYDHVPQEIRLERAYLDSINALKDNSSVAAQRMVAQLEKQKMDVAENILLEDSAREEQLRKLDALQSVFREQATAPRFAPPPDRGNVQPSPSNSKEVVYTHPRLGQITRERLQATARAYNISEQQALQRIMSLQ